jgi:lipoprotein NlpI
MIAVLACLLSLSLSLMASAEKPDIRDDAAALYQRGEARFFEGRLKEAVADWDREIALQPARGPQHWQRGLALYYLADYDKGAAQFTSHQKVNGNDVENAAWHFICTVRGTGGSLETARKQLIPIDGDARIPMQEIHRLFGGSARPDEVLAAAGTNADGLRLRNQLCYAHLYLGLYYEALGEQKKSKEHIQKAAVDFKMDHYMGKVAQLHLKLRSAKE